MNLKSDAQIDDGSRLLRPDQIQIIKAALAYRAKKITGLIEFGFSPASAAVLSQEADRYSDLLAELDREHHAATVLRHSDDLIAQAIVESFGKRCETFDPDCKACRAWADYDLLVEDVAPRQSDKHAASGEHRPNRGTTVSNRDKADCAEREVKQRQRVYARRVQDGKMTQAFADQQIAVMEAIASDYRALADAEETAGRLL